MENYIKQMSSFKGLFIRSFMMCRDCDFVFTTLGQANHELEGGCPSCGEYNVDYATKELRDKFIEGFRSEMEVFEKELAEEDE